MTTPTAAVAGDDRSRSLDVLAGITAVDEVEARHLASARDRAGGDAPLCRVDPPGRAVPAPTRSDVVGVLSVVAG
jgi:hypothetical protein